MREHRSAHAHLQVEGVFGAGVGMQPQAWSLFRPIFHGSVQERWGSAGKARRGGSSQKGFLLELDSGAAGPWSLWQLTRPITQPPVSLLPPWAAARGMCGEQKGDGVPEPFLPASLSRRLLPGGSGR